MDALFILCAIAMIAGALGTFYFRGRYGDLQIAHETQRAAMARLVANAPAGHSGYVRDVADPTGEREYFRARIVVSTEEGSAQQDLFLTEAEYRRAVARDIETEW